MNQKLVLENAGDEATMTVSECRTVQTKFGSKLVFVGTDGEGIAVETPLVPDVTALKQLERIGLTPETCVGESLRFSRAANPSGKPYWNIDVAGPQAAPSKRLAPPAPVKAEVVGKRPDAVKPASVDTDSLTAAYLSLWDRMAQGLALSCATHKVALTADAVQAATATLWIAFANRGITPVAEKAAAPKIPTTPPPSGRRLTAPSAASVVRGSPAGEPDFSKFPPPRDEDATDDLPF